MSLSRLHPRRGQRPGDAGGQGLPGLCMILIGLSVLLIIMKHAENIVRIARHREPRFVFRRDLSHKLDDDKF